MDPRDRADALLAQASAQRHGVVTPDNATSPMDASSTSRIPRSVIHAVDDEQDTMSLTLPTLSPEVTASPSLPASREPDTHPLDVQAVAADRDSRPTEPLEGLLPTIAQHEQQRSVSERLAGLD